MDHVVGCVRIEEDPPAVVAEREKYEIFGAVLTGQAPSGRPPTQAGVDRSTAVHICRTAKQGALDTLAASAPGRPGMSTQDAALAQARAEIDRGRPLHGLPDWEKRAIVELPEAWGDIDRVAPQAGASRLPYRSGARVGAHRAAGAGRRRASVA